MGAPHLTRYAQTKYNFKSILISFFFQTELLSTEWQYHIEWYPGGAARQRSAVIITSEPKAAQEDYNVRMWTNSQGSSDIVTAQHPLSLYVELTFGQSQKPVLNARVDVEVLVTGQNNKTASESIKLRMVDNGSGGIA